MCSMPQLAKPRVLLDGLAIGESPRWHDGRLWLCNWGAAEIVAVGLDGSSEVMTHGPDLLGWSIGWLPDGQMLITGEELVRVEPDGSRVRHAELGHISPYGWNEITVDGRGICLDADGCVWASSASMTNDCARICEGGAVRERIELDRSCFATMLGGPDRRTLFMLVADWRGPENVDEVIEARTGQVLAIDAPASGVGWP
jgi:sugar lactone lactonase YvrE